MTGRRACVVGGTGFVGSHLTRALVEAGWTVTVFGPPGPGAPIDDLMNSIRFIQGSATDLDGTHAAMEMAKPDLVFSLIGHNADGAGLLRASEADADQAIRVNALGLRNVLEASRRSGVTRVIWTSSVVAYGPPHLYGGDRATEEDRLAPITAYGLTKALAEQIGAFYRDAHLLDVSAIRLPLVFGPGRWYQGALSILSLLDDATPQQHSPMKVAHGLFDLVYVNDAVEAIMYMAAHPQPLRPCYNLAGFTTSYPDMIRAIEKRRPSLGIEIEVVDERPLYPLMSDALIGREIDFACRFSLDRALDDYLASVP